MWKPILAILLTAVVAVVIYMMGCSHTSFMDVGALCEAVENRRGTCTVVLPPPEEGCPEGDDSCLDLPPPDPGDPPRDPEAPRGELVETTYPVQLGQVAIVVAIDNSPSMHPEHKSIGRQMQSFLRQIKDLDYRLALITTDISSSPGNPVRGEYYQDGKFIPIGGKRWLENTQIGQSPDPADVNALLAALERPETKRCDEGRSQARNTNNVISAYEDCIANYGEGSSKCRDLSDNRRSSFNDCPSSDERAIYAFNLALERYPDFFGGDAHILFVILSDEDERSSEEFIEARARDGQDYSFEARDYPETLVDTVYQMDPLKTFSVHAIIVPPGDSGCLNEQNGDRKEAGRAYYGDQYARLAIENSRDEPELTKYGNLLKGQVISICKRSFARQLSQIAVYADVPRVSIPCDRPHRVRFFQGGEKIRLRYEIEEGRSLVIKDNVPIASHLEIRVVCEVPSS